MTLASLLSEQLIIPEMVATDRWQAIGEIVDRLVEEGQLDVAQRWLNQAVRIGGNASVKEMAEEDTDLEPLRAFIDAL